MKNNRERRRFGASSVPDAEFHRNAACTHSEGIVRVYILTTYSVGRARGRKKPMGLTYAEKCIY